MMKKVKLKDYYIKSFECISKKIILVTKNKSLMPFFLYQENI
ncbi:hypothetical protein HMPREF9630_01436 [Peptoanaerobacter stomatis]|uniref:Uncharacterized protein n=1 Tax=Peptoanaerobacter stomatis TaxID=796937 RepID=V9HQI0_9FIRM|nr:hypothetical protein [Peptoanaerobacter stomatis]EHL17746.1 hypothetical protein HMPREF9630_01436 [Peptoanaerobacter stomatis]